MIRRVSTTVARPHRRSPWLHEVGPPSPRNYAPNQPSMKGMKGCFKCQLQRRTFLATSTTRLRRRAGGGSAGEEGRPQSTTSDASRSHRGTTSEGDAATERIAPNKAERQSATSPAESELERLRSEIAQLTYAIRLSSTQLVETQAIARRAEARAHIIENKLLDIQRHVVKIPRLEGMADGLRRHIRDYTPPKPVTDAIKRVNSSYGARILWNKYTFWSAGAALVVFSNYRLAMYKRTSEEVAEVASMTLREEKLRGTVQEMLTAVANSPETLSSLSTLFQALIKDERTERQLIDLIVRALSSEGVRTAAIYLLDVAFQNPDLQRRAGVFLREAAELAVLDEGLQASAGVGIQKALKSAVMPPWMTHLWTRSQQSAESQPLAEMEGANKAEPSDGRNVGAIEVVLETEKSPDQPQRIQDLEESKT